MLLEFNRNLNSENKKILVNTFPLKDGGGQTHILKIIEYLNEKNLEVII